MKKNRHTAGKIIMVVKNRTGNTSAFITNAFQTLSLEEVISYVKRGLLMGIHIVETKHGAYVRSNRNQSQADNLNSLSVPAGSLSSQLSARNVKNRVVKAYRAAYGKFLELRYNREELIYLDQVARVTKKAVTQRLRPLVPEIKRSAKELVLDQGLLGAILIDELAQSGPDDLFDILGYAGVNTSVGLAQIKMTTARLVIEKGYSDIPKSSSNADLYEILNEDRESVKFAAAYVRFIIDHRTRRHLGITPKDIATAYSVGHNSKNISQRGKSIVRDVVPLAKNLLGL